MGDGLVIVGGSYAGLNIAAAARQHGYAEPIRILTDEHALPYHRPPLSKGYLLGAVDPETLPLRGEAFYAEQAIEVTFGAKVDRIDPAGRVETGRGEVPFDRLAIATGTRARPLPVPGADLDGVVTLRSLADAEHIQALLPDVEAIVVIGGGFIGLELASSMVKLGKAVTIIEGQGRVLARVTFPLLSAFVEAEHIRHGVRILCNAGVAAIEGAGGKVSGVVTAAGERIAAGLVVVAVGAIPNSELVAPLGLAGANGVEVDGCGRTADPRIVAAGDCAWHPNAFTGTMLRLESVQNATDQAKSAGAAVAGVELPYSSVPWFWSDQYDLKLQMVGMSGGADAELIRGSVEDRKFSIFYLKGRRLIGIDSVNAPADHILGRRLLARGVEVSADAILDADFDLRSLLQ